MYNYFRFLWFGALKHPARWRYAGNDTFVTCGVLVTIACVLFLFFKVALAFGIITLCYWGYVVIRPEYRYILRLSSNERLCLLLFKTGKSAHKNSAKEDTLRQHIILHVFTNKDKKKFRKHEFISAGYDDSLKDCGLFLVKDKSDHWTMVSAEYPYGISLGHNIQHNLYADNTTYAFLHGHEVIKFKANHIKLPPLGLAYDKSKAEYRSLGKKEDFSELKHYMLLLAVYKNRGQIFAFGITENHVPLAFQVFVPYVYPSYCPYGYDNGILPISVNPDDGSFVFF